MKKRAFYILFAVVALALAIAPTTFGRETDFESDNKTILPILMYHELKTYNTRKDVITPYEFESDLKYLRDNGYATITMTELINSVYTGTALPEKPIIISFDDGYYNNYVYGLPLLRQYEMKAVISIIGKNTDDFTRIPDDNLDYSHCTWAQLGEMASSGCFEIQSHTYNLHKISGGRIGCEKIRGESLEEYASLLKEDLDKLQQEMKFNLNIEPNTFAYPYGKVSKQSVPILKELGFKAALTCDYGVNVIGGDPEMLYKLKRICRSHGVNLKSLLNEAMKTLKYN